MAHNVASTADLDPSTILENLPITLHRHSIGIDGSPEWSQAFTRFIGNIKARDMRAARNWREWWHDQYIVSRLLEACRTERETNKVQAVITKLRLDSWHKASYTHNVSINEIARTERQLRRRVRARYSTYAERPY